MLERLLRPQPIDRWRPLGLCLLLGAIAAVAATRWSLPLPNGRIWALLLVPLLAVAVQPRALPWALLLALLALGLGSWGGSAVAGAWTAAMLPLVVGLAQARHQALALGVGAGAAALLVQAAVLAAPAPLLLWASAAGLLGVVAAAVLAAPAVPPPTQLRALAPLLLPTRGTRRRSGLLQVLLQLGLVVVWATQRPSAAPWSTALLLALWLSATGEPAVALLALVLAQAAPAIDPAVTGPGTILVLVPCAWAWWRASAALPEQPAAVAAWTLLVGLVASDLHRASGLWAIGMIGGAVTPLLGTPTAPAHVAPGAQAVPVARLARGLGAYWRWYLPCKWRFDPVFRQLAADPRPWGAVLDVGCGPGLGALLARTRASTTAYTGIDLDLEKLQVARRLLAGLGQPLDAHWRLLAGRLPAPQALPTGFDTVLLLDVLHYWPAEVQQVLLTQLRAATRAGGELWLREALAAADGSAGRAGRGEALATRWGLNPPVPALRFWQAEALHALLASTGWTVQDRAPAGDHNELWRCVAAPLPGTATRAQEPAAAAAVPLSHPSACG